MATNYKKIRKITFVSLGIIIVIFVTTGSYFYYQYYGKYPINNQKYPHNIGYLSYDNQDFSESFERCSDKVPIGYYSSAHNSFRINKGVFRKFILQNFKNQNYTDSGYLNLRFLINCKGEIGDMEINELDDDFRPTKLNTNLINHLIHLSIQKDNWKVPSSKVTRDSYMYLIYKLENGEIVEILP